MAGKRLRKVFMVLLGVGLLCPPIQTSSAQTREVFHGPQGHFSFLVPEGWEKISDGALAALNSRFEQLVGDKATAPSYDLAFQKKSDRPFSYPYMLLQIRADGRISDIEFQKYVASAKERRKVEGAEEVAKAFAADFARNYKVGEQGYSSANKMFFVRTENIAPGVGKIVSLMAKSYSNYGSVTMHFYSTEDNFTADLPYFSQIIDSFKFDEGYAFL